MVARARAPRPSLRTSDSAPGRYGGWPGSYSPNNETEEASLPAVPGWRHRSTTSPSASTYTARLLRLSPGRRQANVRLLSNRSRVAAPPDEAAGPAQLAYELS